MEHVNSNGIIAAATVAAAAATTTTTTTAVAANVTAPVEAAPVKQRQRSLVPQKWEDQVRVIGISEYKEAALSLAQAFARDDLALYLVDAEVGSSDEAKWRLHVDIFKYLVAQHCYRGVVTAIGPDYEGVALWVLPGQNMDEWTTVLRSGMWRLYWQLSPEGRRRYYDELMPLLHDTKLEVLGADRDADCYYLVYLGTKPSGRGRGYARKLIEHMAVRADAEGRAMYLESSSAQNNHYYKKFGFEVKRDIHLGVPGAAGAGAGADGDSDDSGKPPVTLTVMVREPQKKLAKSIPIKLSGNFSGSSKVAREKTEY